MLPREAKLEVRAVAVLRQRQLSAGSFEVYVVGEIKRLGVGVADARAGQYRGVRRIGEVKRQRGREVAARKIFY